MPKLRIINGGPSRDVQQNIASLKARLRRGDVRAFAIVLVHPNGAVSTAWCGAEDGNHHKLGSGIATLAHRFQSETQ